MKIKKIKKKSKILVKAKIIAQQVMNNFDEYQNLSIEDLKIRTNYLVEGLQNNKFSLEDIVVDAFSIAREIIYREYGMLAYEVQMMGAYVVHCGDFAEMYTGEGKSLTILLVAFLNALEKKGVHIVTVNEYLVERDAELARKAFEKLGITVGYNTSKLNKQTKKEMFACDITYTTNSELGFDYLKDNMVRSIDEKVIRGLHFVIIDEGDSVLIDEARTPLIISGQPKEDFSLYLDIDNFVNTLNENDYKIDNESNTISLTDSGVTKAETFFKLDNLYSVESAEIVHKITNALVAHFIFANGKEYLVKDDKIYLIDQFTGRILEGRSYNAGLQQAIQAKERVKIEPENVVMATITYQSFFRLYDKLSAVSGTAMTEAEEFLKIYNMVVVRVPTNKPIIRLDKQDYIFGTKKVKWDHVIAEIVNRHKNGQPILVGTASVTDSEIIHERLKQLNIPHQVLNARDNTKEAEIVKHAGEKGAITISTNMAGRGTDIKVNDEVRSLGGLYVIGTERHESRRIDNQLRGRTGRQGDPGESRFFTSLEDSLFKRFATDKFSKASEKLEDEFYDSKFFSRMLDRTQKKVEGLNFDIRKNLMDYDHVLSLQRELIYKQRDQILLKTNNFDIINNMADDYASFFIDTYKNKDNSALVDSSKLTEYINEKILRFDYFDSSFFENQAILVAVNKFLLILKKVIEIKYNILKEIYATNVIDEILLVNLDQFWTRHIDKMTKLREGVNLRSLEQRSPLNIYIEDGNNLFEKMKSDVVDSVINQICQISLPNEHEKLQQGLDELMNSEEFKKKDYMQNEKQIEPKSKAVNDDEFESTDNKTTIEVKVDQSNEFTTYTQVQHKKIDTLEEFEKEAQSAQQEITNAEILKAPVELNELEELIEKTETKHHIVDEQQQVSIIDEQDEIYKQLFNNEKQWTETEDIVANISKKTEKHKKDKQELADPNLYKDYLYEPENSQTDNNQSLQESINNVNNENNKNAIIDTKDIDDEELEKILSLPAFKEGEKSISLGEYLDNVMNNLELENDDQNNQDETLESKNVTIDTNFKPTLAQQREQQLQELRDEIKDVIAKNIFGDDEFKKYKQGFFENQENRIDYSNYAKNFQESINKSDDLEDNILEFYKKPVATKRKPGTLFGIPLSKYDKPLKPNATFDDYIKSKEENAATQEQLNNLLFVDDERKRLERIDKRNKNIDKDAKYIKKLEKAISKEPVITNNDQNENKQEIYDDSYELSEQEIQKNNAIIFDINHDIGLIDEDAKVISSALTYENDGIVLDEQTCIEFFGEPQEQLEWDPQYEQVLEQDFESDQNLQQSMNMQNPYLQQHLHDEVNQERIDEINEKFGTQKYTVEYDPNDVSQSYIENDINHDFINKFTFKKHKDDKYESEIIREVRSKNVANNANNSTDNMTNLNKEIIELLKRKNSSKK